MQWGQVLVLVRLLVTADFSHSIQSFLITGLYNIGTYQNSDNEVERGFTHRNDFIAEELD